MSGLDWRTVGASARALARKAVVLPALGALVLVGLVAMLAAPGHGAGGATMLGQGQGQGQGTSGQRTPPAAATSTPGASTPTDTPAPGPTPAPTGTPAGARQPTDTPAPGPTPPPTPTATPAPTWHTVGSWSGASAGTAGKATIGSGHPVRFVYTCAAESPAWAMQVGFMSDAGSGGTVANTTCDGASHTLDIGPLMDNPGGDGVYTITVSAYGDPAYNQTVGAWTLMVEVYW